MAYLVCKNNEQGKNGIKYVFDKIHRAKFDGLLGLAIIEKCDRNN